MHEAGLWPSNVFLTLTYDDEHLPPEGQLEPRHLQLFIKRLRRYTDRHPSNIVGDRRHSLRLFACGEYGEQEGRPHYHALLFNCGFTDSTKIGTDLYQSELVRRLWNKGHNRIGQVTHASAAYVAQYSLKKHGKGDRVDANGVFIPGPFLRMSSRPAIGLTWLKRYSSDIQNGYTVEGTRRYPIDRYSRIKLEQLARRMVGQPQTQYNKHHDALIEALETARAKATWQQYQARQQELPARERIHKRRNELNHKRK